MPNPNDPRVRRTRQMLRDALVSLILEKGYDAITIQDITERAGLRRATFYLHYADKQELLLTTLREIMDSMVAYMEATLTYDVLTPEAEYSINLIAFQSAAKDADIYRAILSSTGAQLVTRFMREYLATSIRAKYDEELDTGALPIPIEVLASWLAVQKLHIALWWLEQGMPYPPEAMAEMVMKLTLYGAHGALAEKSPRKV